MTKSDQFEAIEYTKVLLASAEKDGLEVLRVYRRTGSKPWDLLGPIRFPSHHIILVVSGRMTMHIMGETVTLSRGCLMLTTPRTDLRCEVEEGGEATLLTARFDPVVRNRGHHLPQGPAQGGVVMVTPKRESTFEVLMEQLLRTWMRSPDPTAEAAGSCLLHSLLWVLCEEYFETEAESRDKRMEDIRKLLEEEPESQWTIPELALQAGLSEGHFSRRFKKHVGVAPKMYQHQSRMRHAHYLLQEEDLSVQEVADRLGYSDAFVFSRQFKKTWGVSPSKV